MKVITPQLAVSDNIDYMAGFNDSSIDLVLTSPPYNIGKEYEDVIPLELYIEQQKRCIIEAVRILKDTGSICWQVGNQISKGEVIPLDAILYPVFKKCGLILRNRIVWSFGHGLHCKKRFSGRHETVLWFTKSDSYKFNLDAVRVPSKYPNKKHYKGPNKGKLSGNPLGKNPSDVWDITNIKHNHPEKTNHPCQFPVELADRLILSLTDEGDYVMDPFLGSGTTAFSAIKNNRVGLGCDISSNYVSIAMARISKLID